MAEPFLGMLIIVPYNFAPRGWAFCQGQLMSIAQNTALFSLLGTTFGGDGQTTFALPDLRGRVPKGQFQGPGLSDYVLGEEAGVETTTLTLLQMPIHNHVVPAAGLTAVAHVNGAPGNQKSPVGNVPAVEAAGVTAVYSSVAPDQAMASGAVTVGGSANANTNGGSQPFSLLNPFLVMNYCIALEGIFPSRN